MMRSIGSEQDGYEYRGLIASGWDFLRGDTTGFPDRFFYAELLADGGGPGLIVGCGTGRLLLDYLQGGMAVEGLDASPEMAAICLEKASRQGLQAVVHVQAMEAMDLPSQFRTIIVPSSGFQLVPDLDDARRALDALYRHLFPGGLLVMSVWQILSEGLTDWGKWWMVAERKGFEGHKTLRRWERTRYDPAARLRHTENRYELVQDGQVVYTENHRRSPELRSYAPDQISAMLAEAGFTDVQATSGFSHEIASEDDEVFCIRGRRRE